MSKLKIGVLISGGGSNLQAIIDNIENKTIPAEIVLVLSNEPGAGGLDRAERHELAGLTLDHRDFSSREDFEDRLVAELKEREVELVLLAGFMRLLTGRFLQQFPGRVMNIHPALLPSFPGVHVWGDQIEYGVKFAGCTVHFVDEGMDTGPIIIQAVVPVLDGDDADALAARILKQEHRIYPRAVQLFAQGRLKIEGRRVMVRNPDQNREDDVLINPGLVD